jgi:hypothetical protein
MTVPAGQFPLRSASKSEVGKNTTLWYFPTTIRVILGAKPRSAHASVVSQKMDNQERKGERSGKAARTSDKAELFLHNRTEFTLGNAICKTHVSQDS